MRRWPWWAALILVLLLCVLVLDGIRRDYRDEAVRSLDVQHRRLLNELAKNIEAHFDGLARLLELLAGLEEVVRMDERGRRILEEVLAANQDDISAVTRIDASGRIVFTVPRDEKAIGADVSHQAHNRAVLTRHRPVVSDVFTAVQGYRTVALAVPVFDRDEFQGCLTALIPFGYIATGRLSDLTAASDQQAWILSRNGLVLYGNVPGLSGRNALTQELGSPSFRAVVRRMAGGESGTAWYRAPGGSEGGTVRYRAAFRPAETPGNFWSLAVATPESRLMTLGRGFQPQRMILVGLTAALVLTVFFLAVRAEALDRENLRRRRAEGQLARREIEYRRLVENVGSIVLRFDANGDIIYANPFAHEFFGYPPGRLIGLKMNETILPRTESSGRDPSNLVAEIFRRPDLYARHENENILSDGRLVWVAWTNKAVLDADGRPVEILAVGVDITDRKMAEQALRESEGRFRAAFDQSALGVILVDAQGRCRRVNPYLVQYMGRSEDRLVGLHLHDLIHPQDREQLDEAFDGVVSGRLQHTWTELRLKIEEHRHSWMLVSLAAVKTPDDRVGHVIVHLQDVNRRRMAEAALRESQDRYRELYEESQRAEAIYRSLIHSSADAIIIYDLDGAARYVSPAFTRMFGWTGPEVIGRRIPFLPPSESAATMEVIGELLKNGTPCQGFQTKRYTKDGGVLPVSISASRFDGPDGDPEGMLVILRDLTETKRLEAQLLQAQKMEAVGTLAGGIAHDFNNILQAIGGYTHLLGRVCQGQDTALKYVAEIDRSVDRAAELIRQLLTFSRKVTPELKPLDLNREVALAANILKRTIPKMIEIDLDLDQSLPWVEGDSIQMEQALMNLGANARDAMPEGGRLTFRTESVRLDEAFCADHPDLEPGRWIRLSVGDTGVGVDPDDLPHIFEPFYTTKEIGRGTGLGLASVYGVVKAHAGIVICRSRAGRGTVFEIYLPPSEKERERETIPASDLTQAPADHATILLVDDEASIREIGSDMLEQNGYDVLTADSGEDALAVFSRHPEIDAVVLDLGMPGMGGLECLKQMLAADPQARIVVASGYSSDKQVDEILAFGARAFLAKPYRLADFLETVRTALAD